MCQASGRGRGLSPSENLTSCMSFGIGDVTTVRLDSGGKGGAGVFMLSNKSSMSFCIGDGAAVGLDFGGRGGAGVSPTNPETLCQSSIQDGLRHNGRTMLVTKVSNVKSTNIS